jgi:tRNA (mo5U34)-methyltransferase
VDEVEGATSLAGRAGEFAATLEHPSDLMANLRRLDELMEQAACGLDSVVRELPIADIGGGDGDLGSFFESLGYRVHLVDLDVEEGLRLPAPRYGLVTLVGRLPQLKNPYGVLEELSHVSRHCFLGTRVARFAPDGTKIGRLPVAYLLDEPETDDATAGYWICSPAGLRQLLRRTGWEIVARVMAGAERSDPVTPDGEGQAFMLLRSRSAAPWY